MISLKKQQTGFTIVELLIVIVVIGILAALVLNSFQGVQARARDTERRTDINAIATQLEVYYNDNTGYPTATDLANTTWVQENLKGLDVEALSDPRGNALNSATGYTYTVEPTGCDGGIETASNPCGEFTLSATLENGESATYTKNSLNQVDSTTP